MFIATFGIAASLTMSTVFYIFYSMAESLRDLLDAFDYMFKLLMVYFYTFAFIASEMETSRIIFPFLVTIVVSLAVNLVLVQYEVGREISFYTSLLILSIIYLYDFWVFSRTSQKTVFYVPMFVELILLGLTYLLYRYEYPEKWGRKSRFMQLFVTGRIIFVIFLISFIYEAHSILYYTLKLNSGTFNAYEDDWWRINNIFYQDKKQ